MSAGKFLRKDWHKISGLGLRRKNKQVWRKPKGRHNKLRQKWKSHGLFVSIGYGARHAEKGFIKGLAPVRIHTLAQLQQMQKGQIAVIANLGMKKKLALVKKAMELNIPLHVNAKKLLHNLEEKSKGMKQ